MKYPSWSWVNNIFPIEEQENKSAELNFFFFKVKSKVLFGLELKDCVKAQSREKSLAKMLKLCGCRLAFCLS